MSLVRKVRLKVGAGSAKPGPAIGQALGPLGLNMAEFCKQFNEKTKNYDKDIPLPVELSAFSNRTFTFVVKTPPTSWFLLKCAGVERGSKRPGHDIVGSVHIKQIYEIALAKQQDPHLAALSHEALCRCVSTSPSSPPPFAPVPPLSLFPLFSLAPTRILHSPPSPNLPIHH